MKDIHLKDYEEIMKVAQMYLDSCKEGKSEIMKPAFHKNATINGEPIQTLFDGVDQAGASNTTGRIDILDVVNDIAVIRVTMEDYFGDNFVDFHMLRKEEDGWKIVAKIFTGF